MSSADRWLTGLTVISIFLTVLSAALLLDPKIYLAVELVALHPDTAPVVEQEIAKDPIALVFLVVTVTDLICIRRYKKIRKKRASE